MDSNGKPTTPDAPAEKLCAHGSKLGACKIDGECEHKPETKIRIELEYHLVHQRLMIKSKAATIMIEGVLQDAVRNCPSVYVGGPLPADAIVRVNIEYELTTDDLKVDAQAPRIVVIGVIQHALGALTRNQITQAMQVERAKLEGRVAAIEERMGASKIIRPNGAKP